MKGYPLDFVEFQNRFILLFIFFFQCEFQQILSLQSVFGLHLNYRLPTHTRAHIPITTHRTLSVVYVKPTIYGNGIAYPAGIIFKTFRTRSLVNGRMVEWTNNNNNHGKQKVGLHFQSREKPQMFHVV